MSNFLAIATVTETLRFLLSRAITPVVAGVTVSTGKPLAATQGDRTPRVNLFLYQATHNPHWRNDDLPTRARDGSLARKPRVAMDLHYLVTCYGEDTTLDDQQLLGLAVRTFHTHPCLTHDLVDAAVASAAAGFLDQSNLSLEPEAVRITPLQLSLEEMSKLWSVFYLIQYELSAAYVAGPIFIEPEDVPYTVLPVLERNIYVVTQRTPTIENILPATGLGGPILSGATLVISGRQLLAQAPAVTEVRIDRQPTPFSTSSPPSTAEQQLSVPLPAQLKVGSHLLQVQQPMAMGRATQLHGQPPLHPGFESNLYAFVLQPQIVGAVSVSNSQGAGAAPRSATLGLSVDPEILAADQAALSVISLVTGDTFRFLLTGGANPVSVPVTGLPSGDFYVRVTVNGVDSPLTRDTDSSSPTFGLWNGPKVTLA